MIYRWHQLFIHEFNSQYDWRKDFLKWFSLFLGVGGINIKGDFLIPFKFMMQVLKRCVFWQLWGMLSRIIAIPSLLVRYSTNLLKKCDRWFSKYLCSYRWPVPVPLCLRVTSLNESRAWTETEARGGQPRSPLKVTSLQGRPAGIWDGGGSLDYVLLRRRREWKGRWRGGDSPWKGKGGRVQGTPIGCKAGSSCMNGGSWNTWVTLRSRKHRWGSGSRGKFKCLHGSSFQRRLKRSLQ